MSSYKNKTSHLGHECYICFASFNTPGLLHVHKNYTHGPLITQAEKHMNRFNDYDDNKQHTCKSCWFHCPKNYSEELNNYKEKGDPNKTKKEGTDRNNRSKNPIYQKNGATVHQSTRPKKRVKFDTSNGDRVDNMMAVKKNFEELTELFEKLKRA